MINANFESSSSGVAGKTEGINQKFVSKGKSSESSFAYSVWIEPSSIPSSISCNQRGAINFLLDSMKLPIIDDEIFGIVRGYLEHLNIGE